MNISCGINGFGRFGLHLLKYWLDRRDAASFDVRYINDDSLSLQAVLDIIETDPYVQITKVYKVSICGEMLTFTSPDGVSNTILYTRQPAHEISWLGQPDLFLECSGKKLRARDCIIYLKNKTRHTIISATSWDADQTLIFGFNHELFNDESKTLSYGSCTVNAYIPLAAFLHDEFYIASSDVNVIHNIQAYRLKKKKNYTLIRKACTLERSAPNLLPFLTRDNFVVNYTVVPYTGCSLIDFRFSLKKSKSIKDVLLKIEEAIIEGPLKYLYSIDDTDRGPEVHKGTSVSAVIIRDKARLIGNNLYLQCYFDNENSVNRYFDLVNYVSKRKLGLFLPVFNSSEAHIVYLKPLA